MDLYEPPGLRDLVNAITYKPYYRVWHVGDYAATRKKAGED